jgi:argininosuccinate synthase
MKRIVLGYNGGLATTVAIPWLAETHRADVVALTIDLGQGVELEAIRDRALAAGAVRAHVLDVSGPFAREYVAPALRAGALQDRSTVAALARPMIAKTLIEIAAIEQAAAVAHGASSAAGSRNLAAAFAALSPGTPVIAPARDWGMAPAEQVEYASRRNVLCADAATPHERPMPKAAAGRPHEPASVDIRFVSGVPTAINSIEMPLADLVATLATIASAHGVVEPLVTLQTAHDALQRLTLGDELDRFARIAGREYEAIISAGRWFSPLRGALDAFVTAAQESVTGVVRMKLSEGTVETTALRERRPKSLPLVAVR